MELNDCEKCEGFIREAELKRQLAEKDKEIAELKARIRKVLKSHDYSCPACIQNHNVLKGVEYDEV